MAAVVILAPLFREQLLGLEPVVRAVAVLLALLLSLMVGEAVGSAAGAAARARLGRGLLGALDRVAGALVGAVQAFLVIWLLGGLVAAGPSPALAAQAQRSIAVRTLDALLPPPSSFAGEVARLLDESGLPQVFTGLEPPAAPPVGTPSEQEARRIAAGALESTARVQGVACSLLNSGTGFVVERGYVVTNAHVVAGTRRVTVRLDGEHEATVVLFDPELDVALLHVPGLRARPLRFAAAVPERGTTGAALGFPGGGPLTAIPAAVTADYRAQGRDVYGRGVVTRRIIELRALIERGDSGGPLVLRDGTVGGLVFAESRADPAVGYALAPTDVAVRIRPAIGRTRGVSTGACIG